MAFKPLCCKEEIWFQELILESRIISKQQRNSGKEDTCFYLPHCFVFKDAGTTKCTPAVFPGSVNSPTRVSQNDKLHTGPTAHFFTYQVRFTANIKMHQQIMIHPNSLVVLTSWSNPTFPPHCSYHCLQNSFSALQALRYLKKLSDSSKQLQPRL